MVRPSCLTRAVLPLASLVRGINILMTNSDSFASANLRETYRLLKEAGHNVYVVAPAREQCCKGESVVFAAHGCLEEPANYDLIPAGAPSIGPDPKDDHIWYFDGTPAACVLVGLDYVLPQFGGFEVPDLLVSGPDAGLTLGPHAWSVSGTAGAARTAVYRGIPSMAFSAMNMITPYIGPKADVQEATYVARQIKRLVQHFIDDALSRGERRILPLGYGLNINLPDLLGNWHVPQVVHTRMTGVASLGKVVFSEDRGTFWQGQASAPAEGLNARMKGACLLPAETEALHEEDVTTVTVFTVEHDAPEGEAMAGIVGGLDRLNVPQESVEVYCGELPWLILEEEA